MKVVIKYWIGEHVMHLQEQISKKSLLAKILSASGIAFGNKTPEESVASMGDDKVKASLDYFIRDEKLKSVCAKAEQSGLTADEYAFFEQQILRQSLAGGPVPYL